MTEVVIYGIATSRPIVVRSSSSRPRTPPTPPKRTTSLAQNNNTSSPKADPESIMMQLFDDLEYALDPFKSNHSSPTSTRKTSPVSTVRNSSSNDMPPSRTTTHTHIHAHTTTANQAPRLSLPSYFLDSPTTPTQSSFSAEMFASLPMLRGVSVDEGTAPVRVRKGVRKVRPKSRAGEPTTHGQGSSKESGEWTMKDLDRDYAPHFPLPPSIPARSSFKPNTTTVVPPGAHLYAHKPLPPPPPPTINSNASSPTSSLSSSASSSSLASESTITSWSPSSEASDLHTPPSTLVDLPRTSTNRRGSTNLEALEAFLLAHGGGKPERREKFGKDWDAEEEVMAWRGRVGRVGARVTVKGEAPRRVRFEIDED